MFSFLEENQERLLFILGSGRSGTQLISTLLNRAENAVVFHEPNFREDVANMDSLRRDESLLEKYWRNFRCIDVYRRWEDASAGDLYGEVNGTIRYHARVIRELFPRAKVFLIARDGRGVIRSMMGWRQFYGPHAKGAYAIGPLPNDPFYGKWKGMRRFEKLCWSWRDSNEFVMQYVPDNNWLRLESLTSDFDYFNANRGGITIGQKTALCPCGAPVVKGSPPRCLPPGAL